LILFTDLDDTLFASERSLPEGATREHLAAVDGSAAPLSFQSHLQRTLCLLLKEAADLIIPVTGRTSYALERVSLPFRGGYAVVSHGALVTRHGQVLPAWQARLAPQLDGARRAISRAHADLSATLSTAYPGLSLSLRQLEDLEVPVYLSIKAPDTLSAEVNDLLERVARDHGLAIHANTRNAALRPAYTCKAEACRFLLDEVIRRQPEDTLIALGDSLSDMRFMAQCDMAVIPTHSQIWNHLKDHAQ
jgi:predicted mannosyl-3-phosphoglycerate phosphatase (HAD superfamily)